MNIILYLLQLIQYLYQQNCWYLNFICKYIPLKQWAFDDSHSPKYQKFKIDELPKIIKLHYIYREFTVDFFLMDLRSLPKNASSLKFNKHNALIMSLCLTYHVNLQLSLRKTAQALKDIHGISISHQQVANYARTVALVIKPLVDNYDYNPSNTFTADETYIKVRSVKGFIWFIMDAVSRSIIGYRVSEFGEKFKFNITQVIGLTNDDEVSKQFRPYKQMIERLNRTFKASYRVSCGYDNYEGADNMPGKWQLLIFLGQQTIQNLQSAENSNCS